MEKLTPDKLIEMLKKEQDNLTRASNRSHKISSYAIRYSCWKSS